MAKRLIVIGLFIFVSFNVFALSVRSEELTSRYGVTYAERQAGNYIEKNGYAFRYLGDGYWDVKQVSTNSTSGGSGVHRNMIIAMVIASIIHIILTKCVYNMKGGNWACFYFFLAPVALLGLVLFLGKGVGGYKPNQNHITITHKKG